MSPPDYSSARLRPRRAGFRFIRWLHPTKGPIQHRSFVGSDTRFLLLPDAERLLEILRGHYLGGNKLPSVWVADLETRDDREIVAGRQDLSEKQSKIKTQVKTLLKRHGLEKPEGMGSGWTKRYRLWLEGLTEDSRRGLGVRRRLKSLLRQL